MDMLVNYIQRYGIAVFVIACCIIALFGVLKLCKVFDKIKSKEIRKVVFYIVDVALAFAGSAIYFAIFKIKFTLDYVVFSAAQVGATTALYTIYEHLGGRQFVRLIIELITKWLKKTPEQKLGKLESKVAKLQQQIADSKPQETETATVSAEHSKVEEKTTLY